MESSKYFNSCQYSTLKAKDDTLLTVWEDTKQKGQRRTEKRNDQMDQDGDGAYMKLNFNPSELLQALMHLKNQLLSLHCQPTGHNSNVPCQPPHQPLHPTVGQLVIASTYPVS